MHVSDNDIAREEELEQLASKIAEERIKEAVKRNGLTGTSGGKNLVSKALGDYTAAIEDYMSTYIEKKRKPTAYKFIDLLPSGNTAYLVLRHMLNQLDGKPRDYSQVVRSVSDIIARAIGASLYESKDKEGFEELVRRLDWQHRSYVRSRMAEEVFTNNCIEITLTPQEELSLGATLVELFADVTELFVIKTFTKGQNTKKVLSATSKATDWVMDAQRVNLLAMPFSLPMVIPPFSWTNLNDGGYLLQNIHPSELVRKARENKATLEAADLSRVMSAVNSIQETPWRINKRVYDVWQQLLGTGLAGCSSDEHIDIPEGLDSEEPGFEKRKAERRECFEAMADNNAKLMSEAQKSRLAEIFVEEEQFYYPHNIDFRGRIYPMCGIGAINPQGDDSGKALLEFAEGEALGEDGLQWLYIHTQNVWGNDKVSLQARIDATEDNMNTYINYGSDPIANTGWMEADKPFCFLACCFELADVREYWRYTGNLHSEWHKAAQLYISHLPIALDGSCSGLQHFAGMLLDENLAKAVNVIQTSEEPNDIYTMVSDTVEADLLHDDGVESQYWRGKVIRDIPKQPVMTLSYGVSRSGMRGQVVDMCKKLARKGKTEYKTGATTVKDENGDTVTSYAGYMADCIHNSISGVSTGAFDVMDWLGRVAEAKAAHFGNTAEGAMCWTTPIGLPVLQEYYEYDSKRINVYFEDRRIRFTQRLGAAVVDARRQKQGVTPNFVHGNDAAHLMLTVNASVDEGIDSFAMIHDSFATHAGKTGILFEVLRREFIFMYRENVLAQLHGALPSEVQEVCGLPPARGDLDLELVQESEFFFN